MLSVMLSIAVLTNEVCTFYELLSSHPFKSFPRRQGSLSSELQMCGGGEGSILLLPLVARCLESIDVCIWRMFVFMSVVVTV